MQKHTRVYYRHFDFGEEDYVPCELDGSRGVDLHHINGRGKGMDVVNNLVSLCRFHHDQCEMEVISKEEIQKEHDRYLEQYAKTKEIPREDYYNKRYRQSSTSIT